jgi:type VI secretion system secreted protein Hcp
VAIYMKFGDTIKGQVTEDKHKEWIELNSFQFGVGRSVSSGAGGQTRESTAPSISEITVTKVNDVASPKLYEDSLAGAFDSAVTIEMTQTTKKGTETYLKIELSDCGISGYSISSGGDAPSESLSLNFTKIVYTPTPLDNKGNTQKGDVVGYDLLALKTK